MCQLLKQLLDPESPQQLSFYLSGSHLMWDCHPNSIISLPTLRGTSPEAASSSAPTKRVLDQDPVWGGLPSSLPLRNWGFSSAFSWGLRLHNMAQAGFQPISLPLQSFLCPGSEILSRHIPAAQFSLIGSKRVSIFSPNAD